MLLIEVKHANLPICCQVQEDFDELPPDSHSSLLHSLITLLVKYSLGFSPVKTQLCLALASFVAQAPASHWEGRGSVQWFASRLGQEPKEVAVPCMLEMLEVLPEEADSAHVSLTSRRREDFRQELRESFPQMLIILSG